MAMVSLLIKPASGLCNLRCKYCFYTDVTHNREIDSYGLMPVEVLEQIVKKTLNYAKDGCLFAFQGGEPTLVGLGFFQRLIEFVARYNTKKIPVQYSIQTNGIAIDEKWAQFFSENHFLIGLSMDGVSQTNNENRLDFDGKGTHKNVMHTVQLFKKYHVEFNILTVITAQIAKNIGEVYSFYRRNELLYQQYIPCLDPLWETRGAHPYSLTPELYGEFLKKLFDLWYLDVSEGRFIYIRYFENLIGMLLGYPPESCGLMGKCGTQYVVEADGSVYPCDFYVLDQYCMGNLLTDSFETLRQAKAVDAFIAPSLKIDEDCKGCQWYSLCRGGCRRDRDVGKDDLDKTYFCTAYKSFFSHAYPRLLRLAQQSRPNVPNLPYIR